DVFSANVILRNVNLNKLPTGRAAKLSPESIGLTSNMFGASFWHKKIKNHFNANVLNMGTNSQIANQVCN
ncbi:MAG TPA: hypothetical protein VEQ18_04420, partial [Candidatus Nitrosocosmicus sp.]|nr:hypothetical protein [Candidatus Nitrosocosmicus sp.]